MNLDLAQNRPLLTKQVASASCSCSDTAGSINAELATAEASAGCHAEFLSTVYKQYCQRRDRGEPVDSEAFCDRYPELEPDLRLQIELNHLIEEDLPTLLQDTAAAWPKPSDCIMGFKLRELIGKGAFSHVFRAADGSLGDRQVVVKVCHAGQHEAWILGKLKHESIVPIHSIQHDIDSGLSIICMPDLGCTTLGDVIAGVWSSEVAPTRAAEILTSSRPVDGARDGHHPKRSCHRVFNKGTYVEGVVFIGLKLASALAHAHGEGILHLDIKPTNVLLDNNGYPRLLDFNLASNRTQGISRVGGTLSYMSPEQAHCFLNGADGTALDERSDIFSFGVLMYELLCGELPFGRVAPTPSSQGSVKCLIKRQRQFQMPTRWLKLGIDDRLCAIIKRCLAIDPSTRYESAAALAADLQRELSARRTALRWVRAHRRRVVTAVAVAVLLAGGITAGLASRAPYPVREYMRGASCLSAGEYQQSIDHLTHSIEVDPRQPDALLARAQAYVAMDQYHDAARDLAAADKLNRTGKQCALLGYCLNRIRSHAEAASWYERAIEQGYRTTAVFNNLGFSRYRRGRLERAIAALDVAVQQGDKPWVTIRNRALVWHAAAEKEGRRPDEAVQDVERLIALGHCSANTYYHAAVIYAYANSRDPSFKERAIEHLQSALQHGIPIGLVTSNPFFAPLYEEQMSDVQIIVKGDVNGPSNVDFFLNPLE